jgi:hypothetical protein
MVSVDNAGMNSNEWVWIFVSLSGEGMSSISIILFINELIGEIIPPINELSEKIPNFSPDIQATITGARLICGLLQTRPRTTDCRRRQKTRPKFPSWYVISIDHSSY